MSFKRLLPLYGREGLNDLATKTVCVIGCGGVGSYTVTALARSGIGRLILVDPDTVSDCNINRQLMAFHSTIGMSKTAWLKDHCVDINPNIQVIPYDVAFNETTADMILNHPIDYIVDAIDQTNEKILCVTKALEKNIPIITVLTQGNRIGSGDITIKPLKKTTHDPIARKMRYHLKTQIDALSIPAVINEHAPDIEPMGMGCVASSIFAPAMSGLKAAEYVIQALLGGNHD